MKHHLIVMYDSIENSVFASQVLKPLQDRLQQDCDDRATIISFERQPKPSLLPAAINNNTQINYILLKQLPFAGQISLRYAAYQLQKKIDPNSFDTITCRGPLAGWIIAHTKALSTIACIVQARGLCAQEYIYAHQTPNWFAQKIHLVRARQYAAIEQYVYGSFAGKPQVMIHAVSTALRQYLIDTFKASPEKVIVEQGDIPKSIPADTRASWRSALRKKIGINEDAIVYVYNGSAKAWQCPEQTIAYFAQQYQKNSSAYLLILTQDTQSFSTLCTTYELPDTSYYVLFVPHDQIYQYLAAADAGIIFRQTHIINWVSRPTKILEYQAVGLRIIHNNTVSMLVESLS